MSGYPPPPMPYPPMPNPPGMPPNVRVVGSPYVSPAEVFPERFGAFGYKTSPIAGALFNPYYASPPPPPDYYYGGYY